jgi:hypothetical protein
MATSGENVFDMAMFLIDEQDPKTGDTGRAENSEYRARTPGLLNLLMQEVCALDAEWLEGRERGAAPGMVVGLADSLDVSDRVARGLLPYGLAGLLVLEENQASAQYFLGKFNTLKEELKRPAFAAAERVRDVHGGVEHGRFGNW